MSITIDSRGDFVLAPTTPVSAHLNTSALTHDWVSDEITDARAMLASDHPLNRRTRLTSAQVWTIGLILCPLTALAAAALVWGRTPLAVAVPVLAAFAAYLFAALTVWPYRPQWKRLITLATFAAENDAELTLAASGEPFAGSLANRPFYDTLRLAGFERRFGRPIEVLTASRWTIVRIPIVATLPHLTVTANYNETVRRFRRVRPLAATGETVPFDLSLGGGEPLHAHLAAFSRSHTLTIERGSDVASEDDRQAEPMQSPAAWATATRALDAVSNGLLELLVDFAPDFDVEIVDGSVLLSAPVRIDLAKAPFWTLVGRFVGAVKAIEPQSGQHADEPQSQARSSATSPLKREQFIGKPRLRATAPALHIRERWWIEQSIPIMGLAAVLSLIYTKISTLP